MRILSSITGDHWVLALRTVLAVWLALYVALRLDLAQPAWAILAVMIVTLQPVMFTKGTPPLGIIIHRCIGRLIGTFLGALMGLVLIALFAQQPMLYLLAAGGWLAFCTFCVMLLNDEPASYIMMLSGYTATLVSLTAIGTGVDNVFSLALARTTETALGIGAGFLMHVLIAPRFGSYALPATLQALIAGAAGEARVALVEKRSRAVLNERLRALMGKHQQFEAQHSLARFEFRRFRRLLPALDRFAGDSLALMTGLRELEEAIDRLSHCEGAETIMAVLRDPTLPFLAALEQQGDELPPLPVLPDDTSLVASGDCVVLVRASLVRERLGEVLKLLHHGRALSLAMRHHRHARLVQLTGRRPRRSWHPEYGVARYNAFRVFIAFELLGLYWIHSGWPSGYLSMMLLGVFIVLFAKAPDPAAVVRQFLTGTIWAVIIGCVFSYLVFPAITGFPLLALSIGVPVVIGTLMTPHIRYAAVGLAGAVTLMTLLNLHRTYEFHPTQFINGGLASILGTIVTMVTYSLFRQRTPAARLEALLAAYWRGLERLTRTRRLPSRAWLESRLYDRLGRLLALGSGEPMLREAVDLHALAMCLWRLRRLARGGGDDQREIRHWVAALGRQLPHAGRDERAWQRLADDCEARATALYALRPLPTALIGEFEMLAHLLRDMPGAEAQAREALSDADNEEGALDAR
ncbi:fusaric acid resistance protein [Kushneria pakistanensis]|uniref:Fusaric acid resistance protein n=1 Tax=Kushneria pakistanensis TaxID=1508770 RepID=A0ABQ3FK31_9GAMM|nr:FUSC family protein [Kushneria pakistanensis]GHC26362.1 fusaric acid resistance protein [Kushneria pakistanensis]